MSDLTREREKLGDLLRKQQARREQVKGAKRIVREGAIALNKLKGKIAKSQARIKALKISWPQRAVRWAMGQQGTTEKPDGSNWGIPVQNWIKSTGYTFPVPWCGAFAKVAVVDHGKAKIPTPIRLGFNEYIAYDAENKRNGLHEVPYGAARPGDLVVFTFPHIGVVRGKPTSGGLPTVEGNTSPLSSGSQANGGTVAAKTRPRSQVRLIARPDYPA